jgi:hypothetical protein
MSRGLLTDGVKKIYYTRSSRRSSMPESDQVSRNLAAGLCAECLYARQLVSVRGSIFYLCERSNNDPSFRRYPNLPILRCSGYLGKDEATLAR